MNIKAEKVNAVKFTVTLTTEEIVILREQYSDMIEAATEVNHKFDEVTLLDEFIDEIWRLGNPNRYE